MRKENNNPGKDESPSKTYSEEELELAPNSKSLFECIEELHEADEDGPPQDSLLRVKTFFGCTDLEARIISVAVMEGLDNDSVNARSMTRAIHMPLRSIPVVDKILKNLCRKGWLRTRDRDENSYSRDYRPHPRLMDAVSSENESLVLTPEVCGINDHLQSVFQLIETNEYLRIPSAEILNDVMKAHNDQNGLPFVAWLDGHGLSPAELVCVYYVVYKLLDGSDDIDLDDILKCVYPIPAERFQFRMHMIRGELPMTSKQILRYDNHLSGRLVEMNVGETLLSRLSELGVPVSTGSRASKVCERILHGSLMRKELFFDGVLDRQLRAFEKALHPEKLPSLQENLRKKGMTPGLLAIFHGMPGTGKTESAIQIAVRTGRDILKVDLSKIRNKYVGESEKNIRGIFDDYRAACKKDGPTPILLFNEADAVLGRRIVVNASTDQMNNSMQNILLEELEVFQGILIATTNLSINLDEAFERRFTYKFQFGRAGKEALRSVWHSYFPDIDPKVVERLVADHDLSPAQIGNLAKKTEILRLVEEEESTGYEFFRDLIREESLHGNDQKNRIGFRA
jgi:hypothetical protein